MISRERVSYIIPIAVSDDTFGTPVLVYEVENWEGKADLAFGIFFIGLRSNKNYVVGVKIASEDDSIVLIPLESDEFANKKAFRVSEASDGELIVSASLKVNFEGVKVEQPGIYEAQAVLIDVDTKEILSINSSFFDIKPAGMIRDEFRK